MKRLFALLLSLAMIFSFTGCDSKTEASQKSEDPAKSETTSDGEHAVTAPVTLTIASQGSGTSNYVTAATYCSIFQDCLPAGSKINQETISTGVAANGYLIQAGLCDMAGGQNAISALEGLDGREPFTGVLALFATYNSIFSAQIMTDSFLKKTGYTNGLSDVVAAKYPVRIVAEEVGSSDYVVLMLALEALKTSVDEMKGWGCTFNFAGGQACADMLQDGQADLMVAHTMATSSSITELCMSADVTVTSFPDNIIDYFISRGFQETGIPAGTYNGEVSENLRSAAQGNCFQVREDMDFDLAYTLTKAIVENKDFLAKQLGTSWEICTFKDLTNQEAMVIDWHPGGKQYFIDLGVIDETGKYLGEPAAWPTKG